MHNSVLGLGQIQALLVLISTKLADAHIYSESLSLMPLKFDLEYSFSLNYAIFFDGIK